jgi:multicomponent Na+:H+ antiporter subunit E
VEKTSGSNADGPSPGQPEQGGESLPQSLLRLSASLAILALLWFLLTGGDRASWVLGGPVVLLATACSHLMSGRLRHRWRPGGLLRFLPFFFWRSFCASVDVARRALHPKVLLDPDFMDFHLDLPSGAPRLFMANVVSLLPGTLSAELSGDRLRVHVLDAGSGVLEELQDVEKRVARVFGLQPSQKHRPEGTPR